MSVPGYSWGTSPQERLPVFPCDLLLERADETLYRGITIQAPPPIIFRWVCQLRAGTYALGRGDSPDLIPGLDALAAGQSVMSFFEIVSFECDHHLTIRTRPGTPESKFYGDVVASYVILPESEQRCRLLLRCHIRYPATIPGRLLRFVLPWGDLIMSSWQLRKLKKLAEETRP
jgi:hypothetical protein